MLTGSETIIITIALVTLPFWLYALVRIIGSAWFKSKLETFKNCKEEEDDDRENKKN